MRQVNISSQNFNGKIISVTFYSFSNPSVGIDLGTFTAPFVYSADDVWGTYEIYIIEFNKTCSYVINPTPTPTKTLTLTPTKTGTSTPTPTPTPSTEIIAPSIVIEGSIISNFTFGMIKNNSPIGFSKTVSGNNLVLSSSEIDQIIQISPDYLVVNSNSSSIDTETNQPIEFQYTYLYDLNKINSKTIFSAISTIYNEIVQLGESNPVNLIQNIFGFNITNYINPNGNDRFTFSNTINNAYETNRKLSSIVLVAKTALETNEENAFSSIAKTIIADNSTRPNPADFFNQKTSDILVEVKKKILNLDDNQQLTTEQASEINIIANNTKTIINKDIEEFSKGNKFSSTVFTKKILENIGDIKQNKTTEIANIAEQISEESARVITPTPTPTPTLTSTSTPTPTPTQTPTQTLPSATDESLVFSLINLSFLNSELDVYDIMF